MRDEWNEAQLGDLLTLKRGYDLPATQREGGRFPVVSSAGIVGMHSAAKVQAPGVVTGRTGTLGRVFYLDTSFWPLNTALYVEDFRGNDPRFCAYVLETLPYANFSTKSAVPGVNRNDLHTVGIAIPPLAEQRRIADLMSAVDQQLSAQEGLLLSATRSRTAVVSDLLTPRDGWTVKAISDVANLNPEQVSLSERVGTLTYIDLAAVGADVGINRDLARTIGWADAPSRARRLVKEGDILVATVRPGLRGYGRVDRDLAGSVASTGFCVVRSKSGLVDPYFLWASATTGSLADYLVRAQSGSNYPAVRASDVGAYKLFVPPLAEQIGIGELVSSADRELSALRDSVAATKRLRAALLQDLLSGEHEIPASYDRFLEDQGDLTDQAVAPVEAD